MPSYNDFTIKDFDKILHHDGTIKNVKTSRLIAPGENYISVVLRVEVDVEKKNGEIEKKDIVAKRVPSGERFLIQLSMRSMQNEIIWYTEIKPILIDFSQQYGIDCSHLYAKYCGSRLSLDPTKETANRDSILLIENLNPQGYRNGNRLIGFDFLTCKSVLKNLALFHVIPLALKFNQPEKFKIIKDYIFNFPIQPPPSREPREIPPQFDVSKLLIKSLANIPECAPHMEKLESLLNISAFGNKDWLINAPEPWSTVVHSDFWMNNILVKSGTEGQTPAIKFVDFQTCEYKHFVHDIIFFLLTSVQEEIQKTQLDDLLKIYYEEFTDLLQKFNVDLKITYEEYLADIANVLQKGEMCHIIVSCIIMLTKKNSISDDAPVEDIDPALLLFKSIPNLSELQKERLILIINYVIERNWI